MKKVDMEVQGELRPEYDLNRLKVRKVGPGRNSFGAFVRLDEDVAAVFPNAEAVNEALRFLIRVPKDGQPTLAGAETLT